MTIGRDAGDRRAPDRVIADLAAQQRGVVARQQLLEAGLGPDMVQGRLDRGRLHRFPNGLRGVYLVGHASPLPLALEHGALLACGVRDALLSHRSALWLWDLGPRPDAIEVLVVGGAASRRRPAVVGHAVAALPAEDRRRVLGLPVTGPARTILDVAATLSAGDLAAIVDRARAAGVVRRGELERALARSAGRRGAAALRHVLRERTGPQFSRSEAERRVADLVARVPDLPRPQRNARLHGHEVDLLWPRKRVVVEVDGYAFHGPRRAFEHDRARDAELTARGYRVVRVTWRQLVEEPEVLLVRIALLLRPVATAA